MVGSFDFDDAVHVLMGIQTIGYRNIIKVCPLVGGDRGFSLLKHEGAIEWLESVLLTMNQSLELASRR
jgi:hypothetical protein